MLEAKSGVSDALMTLWCKEKALEDFIMGVRDKNLPLADMLREIRALSKKQFKVKSKIKKLYAYHQANKY
jgi:hypothetical protein